MATPRVLVVEDETHIRELVCLHLGLEGYECLQAADGREALRAAGAGKLDLIVLDLMIPSIDGVTVCRAVRREGPNRDVPILMLTARREESDKVLGLDSGADDYLTKPFGVRELVARCHALLRRVRRSHEELAADAARGEQPLTIHGVEIDPAKRRVRVRGREIELTNQEFTLLLLFAEHPGIVFSREALLEKIWKGDTYVTERSVDTLVKRLRHKVEDDPANPALILTQWGVGYKFADLA
jgi:two-component system OmpR family response regulator/two-component system alkaline phosphatase synthesis response regulator PhoP